MLARGVWDRWAQHLRLAKVSLTIWSDFSGERENKTIRSYNLTRPPSTPGEDNPNHIQAWQPPIIAALRAELDTL